MTATTKPIFRLERVPTLNAVRSLSRHWLRTQETPNADATMADGVRVLHGSGDPVADVQAVLQTLNRKPRKDACTAIEGLASVSAAHFQTGDQERDPAKVATWSETTMQHLRKQFGERLVSAVLHTDEQTPHIQFLLVPVEAKERKPAGKAKDRTPRQERGLNAKGLMGDRSTLSAYQGAYEAAMSPLGVGQRTRKTVRAPDRLTVQEWYGRAEEAVQEKERAATEAQEARDAAQAARVTAISKETRAGLVLSNAQLIRVDAEDEKKAAQDDRAAAAAERAAAAQGATKMRAILIGVDAVENGKIIGASTNESGARVLSMTGTDNEKAALVRDISPAWEQVWVIAHKVLSSAQKADSLLAEARTKAEQFVAVVRKEAADLHQRALAVKTFITRAEREQVITMHQQAITLSSTPKPRNGSERDQGSR